MAPTLPSSLSPHVCILPSPDLQELLANASLPPLSQILQSFTPLAQVTTRTTTLTPTPHASFALRFSELADVEGAAHEDEEQRAGRTMDWIGARVGARAARWVEAVEREQEEHGERARPTPWWEEVRRCVEGDCVPNRFEGWNHPVAIVYAVSTLASNPLQALQDLHTRGVDLPPWVDNTHLRYSLIVHPSNSPLTDPIAEALFNAVKKQYGLHSYLLPLALPTAPLPAPVTVPLPTPRLPPISSMTYSPIPPTQLPGALRTVSPMPPNGTQSPAPPPQQLTPGTLHLTQPDIQQTGRFVREFVVMSLLPWMEKCVLEWNEVYSSSRRLPSRLFTSTKRLFGSSYTSTATSSAPSTPTHGSNPSLSSVASRFASHTSNSSVSSLASISSSTGAVGGAVTQQRRLAEFATVLGDYKLAMSVWETLRKDSKGGSDILPLLLSPSLALALHASTAVASLSALAGECPALAQMRALVYAVRWDIGVDSRDFLGPVLEGDRWLVLAAGAAEEPPTALLLGHAAFLSARRRACRRAALWYLFAADRLEKAGLKPIALYFFRQSHELYKNPTNKSLSPAFWESEGKEQESWRGFESVLPGIEHELGRLLYTTGDTEGAVRYFLGLLRGSDRRPSRQATTGLGFADGGELQQNGKALPPPTDRVYLEDFRVALKHFRTTEEERWKASASELKLPINFCQAKQTRVRLPGDAVEGDPEVWRVIEDDWAAFWRPRGQERLELSGKAAVNESFWVDMVFYNPLNVEVTISNLTVVVKEAKHEDAETPVDFAEAEVVDEISLNAHETRTIPIAVKCSRPACLVISHVTFDFLSLLPVKESLAIRGRRLHDTPLQRQNKIYAPDTLITVDVEDASQRLQAHFVDDRHLVLAQGECRHINVLLKNSGKNAIDELWLVTQSHQEVLVDFADPSSSASSSVGITEVLRSSNTIAPQEPFRIPLGGDSGFASLGPGEDLSLPLQFHAEQSGDHDLALLLVFREANAPAFHSTRLTRHYEVRPILEVSPSSDVGRSTEYPFTVNVDIKNLTAGSNISIYQVTTLSPIWSCAPLTEDALGTLPPRQTTRVPFGADRWDRGSGTEVAQFVARQFRAVLHGDSVPEENPPPLDVLCRHAVKDRPPRSVNDAVTRHFIHSGRRRVVCHSLAASHPQIPLELHRAIFPLYNPSSVDVLVFWEIPAQGRSGHVLVTGLTLGASHAPLRELIEDMETAKVKRDMYAETRRERLDVLDSVKRSEWNVAMNPLAVIVKDGAIINHDFTKGSTRIPVTFMLRNLSLTNPARYTLKLTAHPERPPGPSLASPAPHVGRLTYKGQLSPLESTAINTTLWINHPGMYTLNSWTAETEVGEALEKPDSGDAWKIRDRYEQSPQAGDSSSITVVDASQVL